MKKAFDKIIFAGDRDISVRVLDFMIKSGVKPVALMVSDSKRATHSRELMSLCRYLPKQNILIGDQFKSKQGLAFLNEMKPDYFINIHFPYIYPKEVLKIPKYGSINLHPAYLPFGRGWHTPTWAILDKTPYGATLHFMNEKIDNGDILHQKRINVLPFDTANTLYNRTKQLELDVFKEAWPSLLAGSYVRRHQLKSKKSTSHTKSDILRVQCIDLKKKTTLEEFIDRLRALTTNDIKEAAYYEVDGKKYRIRVDISEET